MTTTKDWLLLRGGEQFRDSSGISREKENDIFVALTSFLNENGLARERLPSPNGGDWEGYEIRQSQLTEQGWSAVSKAMPKWLAGIDKGRDPSDVALLRKAIK